jgi:hypothetical protein
MDIADRLLTAKLQAQLGMLTTAPVTQLKARS